MRECALFIFLTLALFSRVEAASDLPASVAEVSGKMKVNLPDARDYIDLVRLNDGSLGYIVHFSSGDQLLTPDALSQLLYETNASQSFALRLLNITSWSGLFWIGLGILGQALFAGRMLLQWILSEMRGQSVIPVGFWWMSLGGSLIMVSYFIWRQDIVPALGTSLPAIIYIRNLMLIHRRVAKPVVD